MGTLWSRAGIPQELPVKAFLNILKQQYINDFNAANDSLEALKHRLGEDYYSKLKEHYSNENMMLIVTNHYNLDKVVLDKSSRELLQTIDPIYLNPKTVRFLDTPLYSKYKYIFGKKVSTFAFNMTVLWLFTFLAFIALYYDWLKKSLDIIKNLRKKP